MNELVKRAKNGDKKAFTKLIKIISEDLYRMARIRLKNEIDINEVVQETIIKIYKSIKTVRREEAFKKWAIKILVNCCNDVYNKSYNKYEFLEENIEKVYVNKNCFDCDIEKKIDDMDFEILIRKLSYKERIVLTLYYSDGLTSRQIGKILEEPESTIKNRINRAVKKLRFSYEVESYKETIEN